jgi:hypothetical protein
MVFATDPRVHDSSIPAEVALQMSETASPPVAAEQTAADNDVVSPELALIDPRLRERLATAPPPEPRPRPEPELKPEPRLAATSALADEPAVTVEEVPAPAAADATAVQPSLAEPTAEAAPALPAPVPAPVAGSGRRWWPVLVAALVGAVLAIAATFAFLPGRKSTPQTARVVDPASTGQIGLPASSTPTTHVTTALTPTTPTTPVARTTGHSSPPATHPVTTVAKPKPKTTPKSSQHPKPKPPSSGGTTTHDKLAWAPAAGATAYDIDLLRGSKRVFHVRTPEASIVIAVRTGPNGPAGSLPAGQYEWIVWPIVNGKRAAQAIVRSPLKLPS